MSASISFRRDSLRGCSLPVACPAGKKLTAISGGQILRRLVEARQHWTTRPTFRGASPAWMVVCDSTLLRLSPPQIGFVTKGFPQRTQVYEQLPNTAHQVLKGAFQFTFLRHGHWQMSSATSLDSCHIPTLPRQGIGSASRRTWVRCHQTG